MEKILFVYNPASGKRNIASHLDKIISIFTEEDKIPTLFRLGENNGNSVKDIITSGDFDGIVVAGGDGSGRVQR